MHLDIRNHQRLTFLYEGHEPMYRLQIDTIVNINRLWTYILTRVQL